MLFYYMYITKLEILTAKLCILLQSAGPTIKMFPHFFPVLTSIF